jgi:hypothetical protein
MKLFYKALIVLTVLLIVLPVLMVKVSAAPQIVDISGNVDPSAIITNAINNTNWDDVPNESNVVYVTGISEYQGQLYIRFNKNYECIIYWDAVYRGMLNISDVSWDNPDNWAQNSSLIFNSGAELGAIEILYNDNSTIRINRGVTVNGSLNGPDGMLIYIDNEANIDPYLIDEMLNKSYFDSPDPNENNNENEEIIEQSVPDLNPTPASAPAPETGETANPTKITLKSENHLFPSFVRPTVEITDDKPFEQDGQTYYGIVDIVNVDTDKPQEIPKEVFIDGLRYLVGETIYIVAKKDLEIVGYAETGVSYVFPAVENVAREAAFSAEGLPEGVILSEGGVLSTEVLPLNPGSYEFTVTVDNGVDTNTIEVTLTIKSGYASDEELTADLTKNDKENAPAILEKDGEEKESDGVPGLWINADLTLHYDPDFEDFEKLFLDGKLLKLGEDYLVKNGSTVIILTEQTLAPLQNGDHVVTTMFHQDSEVGLDTVINDVGSSSFVFRFGDEKKDAKRVNISGDGVTGSVSFDDKGSEEQPLTALSANTEQIQARAANLSNATGNEIIAAFETKQTGGFGGKTATFAVSVKSLDLTLKNGTAVYIAVYDAKSGKTYQNKGSVKDGMIVFRTKHSGVFMISLEKY